MKKFILKSAGFIAAAILAMIFLLSVRILAISGMGSHRPVQQDTVFECSSME